MLGRRLHQYEILAALGAGGMGEVYRARDTKLDRDVAIKILPSEMSGDPERVARFRREARSLASLQHPNIASIYGYDEVDSVRFLAMELVEGEELSVRISRGPLPEADAAEILIKVARALQAAHAQSIVHRDLKPANIMITRDGEVKVLDFGLARAMSGEHDGDEDPELSPTITAAMTQAGTILGTAAYMSPEQARGRRVDARADVWALGAIYYEMLTGRRLFEGETITDVLAAVIRLEPDFDALPANVSRASRRALRRCLIKNPHDRLHSAADLALELLDRGDSGSRPTPIPSRGRLPWILVALLALAMMGMQWKLGRRPAAIAPTRAFDLALPSSMENMTGGSSLAISPDERWVVMGLVDSLENQVSYLRSLETGEAEILPFEVRGDPDWSPDSRSIAFSSSPSLQIYDLSTRTLKVLEEARVSTARGLSWSTRGSILYPPSANAGLDIVDLATGRVRAVTQVDSTLVDGSHRWPHFLPDGNRFVYTLWSNLADERSSVGGIYLGSLDGAEPRQLLPDVSASLLDPRGQLLFHRSGQLVAVTFDLDRGEVRGEARSVFADIGFATGNGAISAAIGGKGLLMASSQVVRQRLQPQWFARDGRALDTVGDALASAYLGNALFQIDPATEHYTFERIDDVGSVQVWVGDLRRGTVARISRVDVDCASPMFSPDGREVAYLVVAEGNSQLYRQDIAGVRLPSIIAQDDDEDPLDRITQWSPRGFFLADARSSGVRALGIVRVDAQTGERSAVLSDDFSQERASVSPDGRWLTYVSWESGRPEVYVRSWPDLQQKWLISAEGGTLPRWNSRGDEILFRSRSASELRAASFEVSADGVVEIGLPRRAFRIARGRRLLAVAPDHQRVLVGVVDGAVGVQPLRVLSGW